VHLLVGGLIGVVDGADDMICREAVGSTGGEWRARVADDREVLEFVQGELSSTVWKTLTRFSFTSQTTPGISGFGGAWNMPRVLGGCRNVIAGRSRISSISYRPFLKTYPTLLTLQPWLMVSIHDAFMLG
jgi:hypothetical protein